MTFDKFHAIVNEEPGLSAALDRTAKAAFKDTPHTRQFGPVTLMAGMAAVVILFPIVNEFVRRVGLPWVKSVANYSEFWRGEFERWLDQRYKEASVDRAKAEAAGQALLQELQATADANVQRAWERLMQVKGTQDNKG